MAERLSGSQVAAKMRWLLPCSMLSNDWSTSQAIANNSQPPPTISMTPAATISFDEEAVRPTHVEVDLAQLARNFAAIRAHVGPTRIMAILKANAYGHGLVPVARQMVRDGADYLGVAF